MIKSTIIFLVSLPENALCLMLVIDGSEVTLETENCDNELYSLCCEYSYYYCIHSFRIITVVYVTVKIRPLILDTCNSFISIL